MAAKKKRAPRLVWCAINAAGKAVGVYPTKRAAVAASGATYAPVEIVGPYHLAERKAHR